MNILAIDPGTNCGFRTKSFSGWVQFKHRANESDGLRLVRFRKYLKDIIESDNINLIVFEKPGGRNYTGVISHSEFVGIIKEVALDYGIDYKGYSAGSIKKFATGNGNANKDMMVEAAVHKLDLKIETHDQADAAWLYELAKKEFG